MYAQSIGRLPSRKISAEQQCKQRGRNSSTTKKQTKKYTRYSALHIEPSTCHSKKEKRKKEINKTNKEAEQGSRIDSLNTTEDKTSQNINTKRANDTPIQHNPISQSDAIWGHALKTKEPNTIRIILQNTGGIDHRSGSSTKLSALHSFMQEWQVDIAALTECNAAWSKIDHSLYPSEQTKFWWENAHWSLTHNRQDQHAAPYQPGGAGIVITNQLSYRAQRPGDDTVGLGRWCWARLRGKHNQYLRVVSVYRPCPANGPLSTYQQHVRHWSSKHLDCCPREKLLNDLKAEVAQWQEAGDQVIILADMNDDVNAPALQKFCRELHLVEAISSMHGPAKTPTHQRGQKAIDGIYISRSLLSHAKGGFLLFGEVMASDHRAVWIDIRAETVGMADQDMISCPAKQRLKCQDPRIVGKYTKDLLAEITSQKWDTVIEELFVAASTNTWTETHLKQYNTIDLTLSQAKLAAENSCRKFRAGKIPWTPVLTQAINRILYWKGMAKHAARGRMSTTVLKRRATKGQIIFSVNHWNLTNQALSQRVKSAYEDYYSIKAQTDRRDTWIGQLIEAKAAAKDVPKARLWKQLRQTEAARAKAGQVKRALGLAHSHTGLNQVNIPDPVNSNQRLIVNDKHTLEKACLDEAHRRFTQAAVAPIANLSSTAGLGNLDTGSPAFLQILNGTYDTTNIQDPYTVKLIKQLARPRGITEIASRTEAEYITGWVRAKEKTASSPSGIHFGHYIAGVEEIVIAKINRLMATIPMMTGISPIWWRTTLNVMLEKLAGNCSVEKLRIIMLFEADLNNNNKWLGRALMANAEKHKALAPEQYGSRKGKAAGIQCLNKRLFYDYIRGRRIPAALCSNDAKSCYDRIVLIIAALCLCRLGAPIKATASMITTLAQLRHHVRSAFGSSTQSQGQQEWTEPVAGIGQGNGAGPQIWAAVSTPLFEILSQDGFVATFICSLSKQHRQMAGFAFVDDTDLIVTDASNDEKQVTQKMQSSLSLWHGLLQATGGDLVPEKCFWYLIDFAWENKGWHYKTWNDRDRILQIPQQDGTPVTIPRLLTSEARRTLGVRLAPDGNNNAEYAHLREEAIQWRNHMATATLSRAAADFSIRQVLLPKLRYPLVATTFTEAQCQAIMQPVLQQSLPALGVNRNYPRAVAHGPVIYQGLNLPNLYSEQLITHITTLLKYGSQNEDPTGTLIRACGETMRLEAGVSGPLFHISPNLSVCMTDTWMSQCWHRCVQRGIFINTDIQDFALPRQRDRPLMEVFLETGYRDKELALLNRCRMHLRVIFLSDICNGQGTALEKQLWEGTTPADHHPYSWPKSHPPTPAEWAQWQRALTRSLNLGRAQQLPVPLGKWLPNITQTDGWFTNPDGTQLYRQQQNEWVTFTPIPLRRRTRSFHSTSHPRATDLSQLELHRATTYQHGDIITVTGHGPIGTTPTVELNEKKFWETWQCEETIVGQVEILIQAIRTGKAVAVSDGSYKDQHGAAAWTIESETDLNRLSGAGLTPGYPEDQSAYRSELFGIWGILASLKHLSDTHQIKGGTVVVACNGLSALKKARNQYPTDPGEAHYDLISAIRQLRQLLPFKITFEHVKGHQDQGIPTALTRLAWMNINMDKAAKAKLLSVGPDKQQGSIPYEGWTCAIEGRRSIKHLVTDLRQHLNGKIILNHWATKERFSPQVAKTIDWDATGRAMNSLPLPQRQWVSKLAAKFLPDGKNMKRWGLRTQSKCPRCQCPIEDKDHIFKCQSESAQQQWMKAVEDLDRWLQAAKTHPQLRKDLIEGLQHWHDQTPSCRPHIEGTTAGQLQDSIGWGIALEGCIARRWREEQEVYWKAFKSRKSSRRWTTELIKRLMMTAWDMWNHRNKALHEEASNRNSILEDAVNQQIREVYDQGTDQIPTEAQTLMKRPLPKLLKLPESYKKQWLDSVEAARARFIRLREIPSRQAQRPRQH